MSVKHDTFTSVKHESHTKTQLQSNMTRSRIYDNFSQSRQNCTKTRQLSQTRRFTSKESRLMQTANNRFTKRLIT